MTNFILHHYDEAPFAEKIRLVFGIKNLDWFSVIQPATMPKPDLLPLTGGYRRTPVFQVGADIYCDTQLIASYLEQACPQPSIFPNGNQGLHMALGNWANGPYVVSSVAIYMGADDPFAGTVKLPSNMHEDRKKMWQTQFDTDSLGPKLAGYRAQLDAHTHLINQQLKDGRNFLMGAEPSWFDIHAMWDPWFLIRFAPKEAHRAYDRFPLIRKWLERVESLGHGQRIEMKASEALDIAKESKPLPTNGIDPDDPLELKEDSTVCVSPADYAEAEIIGDLVATTVSTISIRREDPRVGEVCVHFPKIGYSVKAV